MTLQPCIERVGQNCLNWMIHDELGLLRSGLNQLLDRDKSGLTCPKHDEIEP